MEAGIWTTFLHGLFVLQLLGSAQPAPSCRLLTSERLYFKPTSYHAKVTFANSSTIVCENIRDSSDVTLAERQLRELSTPGKKLAIQFELCDLDAFPANFFALLEISYLAFDGCHMSDIPYDLVNSVRDTLKSLWIIESPVRSATIKAAGFQGNYKMEDVLFDSSGIEEVEGDAFLGFPNLIELILTKNNLQIIDKGAFNGLNKLKKLSMNYNKIQSLDRDVFGDLIDLETLDLSLNNLRMLKDGIFDPLQKLKIVDFTGNSLDCDCDVKWLQDSLKDGKVKYNGLWDLKYCTPNCGGFNKKTESRDYSMNATLTDDQTWFDHVASFLFLFFVL